MVGSTAKIPAVTIAQDSEDDGYAIDENGDYLYGCNDGIDNDGHGDIDGRLVLQHQWCNVRRKPKCAPNVMMVRQ